MAISDEDKALFRATIGRVKRVTNPRGKVQHPRPKRPIIIHKPLREEMILQDLMSDDPTWIETDIESEMRFRKDGVSPKILRKLVQGDFSPEASIDLHGLTASQARDALQEFLYFALKQNLFCIKIVHGQGHSSQGDPIIRGLIARWLPLQADILAFANPPQRYGGRGVTLCILKSQDPFGKFD